MMLFMLHLKTEGGVLKWWAILERNLFFSLSNKSIKVIKAKVKNPRVQAIKGGLRRLQRENKGFDNGTDSEYKARTRKAAAVGRRRGEVRGSVWVVQKSLRFSSGPRGLDFFVQYIIIKYPE